MRCAPIARKFVPKRLFSTLVLATACTASVAHAAPIFWTDWQTSNTSSGFTGFGTITTNTATVNVTYNNPQGIAFYQTGTGTDYFTDNGGNRNPATSPYTSSLVDNIPTAAEMIALQFAGTQTLTFSQAVANPVFSYVSLNGNGYAFDQDFDILSFGDGTVRAAGYWGAGTSTKSIVGTEYQLLGTGEPHGTIRFKGAFSTVSWRSLSSEYWNGFTVGVQGTAVEVFAAVPEPSTILAAGFGVIAGLGAFARRRTRRAL